MCCHTVLRCCTRVLSQCDEYSITDSELSDMLEDDIDLNLNIAKLWQRKSEQQLQQ